MLKSIMLCNLNQVPIKGALGFDPFDEGRDTVFLVNTENGLWAYKDLCPHYGDTTLPWRKNAYLNSAATKIVCAAHGAEFEIKSGLCVSGPCLGQSLKAVPLVINDDGSIMASVKKMESSVE